MGADAEDEQRSGAETSFRGSGWKICYDCIQYISESILEGYGRGEV